MFHDLERLEMWSTCVHVGCLDKLLGLKCLSRREVVEDRSLWRGGGQSARNKEAKKLEAAIRKRARLVRVIN